ncbi:MAG: hypothetical protein H0V41_11895 [Pseudonocardiales bacterium]|nr:hypothetical protein [Pseudonocardiales bacterium]
MSRVVASALLGLLRLLNLLLLLGRPSAPKDVELRSQIENVNSPPSTISTDLGRYLTLCGNRHRAASDQRRALMIPLLGYWRLGAMDS